MTNPESLKTAQTAQREALSTSVGHSGPTAERYQSALERYVEAVASDQPPHKGEVSALRLTFPPLTVSDVMTRAIVSAYAGAVFKEIASALDRNSINAVPVIDEAHKVVGVVTASDLLARIGHVRPIPRGHRLSGRSENSRKEHGATAKELMTSPAITVSPSTSISEAARQLARYRIRSMPVVDKDGALVGMVSRVDLIKLFLRTDEDICNDVLRDVVRRDAFPRHSNVRVSVTEGVVTLEGRVDTALNARGLAYEAAKVPGVVDVHDQLEYDVNDMYLPISR